MDFEREINRDEEMGQTEANTEKDHLELQTALRDYMNGDITSEQYLEIVTNVVNRSEQE